MLPYQAPKCDDCAVNRTSNETPALVSRPLRPAALHAALIACIGLLMPSHAWAHPGHGHTDNLVAHQVVEPVHAMVWVSLVVVAAGVWWHRRRTTRD